MARLAEKKDCTGCGACFSVCGANAITMTEDLEGFLYPNMDAKRCVNCKKCTAVCPVINCTSGRKTVLKAYGLKNRNLSIRKQSASGGAFSAIAEYMINHYNAYIFGAKFDSEFNVVHDYTSSIEGLTAFRGSKYIQSNLNDCFKEIKRLLSEGKYVMFTGTPCQVHGLVEFLGHKYDNLLTVDLICHGLPSPKIWKSFLEFVEQKYKAKLRFCNLRSHWQGVHTKLFFEKKSFEDRKDILSFLDIFYSSYAMRPSCYRCRYTNLNRVSDITIADFWGIENVRADFKDEFGVSIALINSEKGINVFENLKDNIQYFETDVSKTNQPHLKYPIKVSSEKDRNEFWNTYNRFGYDILAKRYSRYGFVNNLKRNFNIALTMLKSVIKEVIRYDKKL